MLVTRERKIFRKSSQKHILSERKETALFFFQQKIFYLLHRFLICGIK